MSDPSRIINGDETDFQICPSTGRVLATKEAKMYTLLDKGHQKKILLYVFIFSRWKNMSPCDKRIPENISETVPAEWYGMRVLLGVTMGG
jgi:hypothetical protein